MAPRKRGRRRRARAAKNRAGGALAFFSALILRSPRSGRLEGWAAYRSRVYPEIGIMSAQVGYSRLVVFETRRFAALLTMRRLSVVSPARKIVT